MAKEPSKKPASDADAVNEIPLSIEEFCLRQSRIKTTSLVTAFFHSETRAGRVVDVSSAYAKRYVEFANTPAK